jgi:hypothetical protein
VRNAFTGERPFGRDAIVAYAIAFLDRHVKGAPESPVLRSKGSGVERYLRDP